MINIIAGAGIFVWPLGLCSILALFIIIERLIALRSSRVLPQDLAEALMGGRLPTDSGSGSVAGRILHFFQEAHPDTDQLKAFARLEITRMERGLFILDIVVKAAPLLGLLGTVTGLVRVFANVSPETGLPEPGAFIEGTALALTTTMIGLSVAIPALVGESYLYRRVDTFAAQLNVGVERLMDIRRREGASAPGDGDFAGPAA